MPILLYLSLIATGAVGGSLLNNATTPVTPVTVTPNESNSDKYGKLLLYAAGAALLFVAGKKLIKRV